MFPMPDYRQANSRAMPGRADPIGLQAAGMANRRMPACPIAPIRNVRRGRAAHNPELDFILIERFRRIHCE